MPLHGSTEGEFGFVVRVGRLFQKRLIIVDRQIQIEMIHVSAEEMELAGDLRPQAGPVALAIFKQVVTVIAHVVGDVVIDLARQLIP